MADNTAIKKAILLPKEVVEWVILFLSSKVDMTGEIPHIKENRSNRVKPYSGIPLQISQNIQQNSTVKWLTVLEIKMLLQELDLHMDNVNFSYSNLQKNVPKSKWLDYFLRMFYPDLPSPKLAVKTAPIWDAIQASLSDIEIRMKRMPQKKSSMCTPLTKKSNKQNKVSKKCPKIKPINSSKNINDLPIKTTTSESSTTSMAGISPTGSTLQPLKVKPINSSKSTNDLPIKTTTSEGSTTSMAGISPTRYEFKTLHLPPTLQYFDYPVVPFQHHLLNQGTNTLVARTVPTTDIVDATNNIMFPLANVAATRSSLSSSCPKSVIGKKRTRECNIPNKSDISVNKDITSLPCPASFQNPQTKKKSADNMHLDLSMISSNSTKNTLNRPKNKLAIKIKKEKVDIDGTELDYSMQPQNFQEKIMLAELQEMGFSETHEAMGGIKYALNASPEGKSLVDTAMMWIVNQREAIAEARCLDAARMSSEITREIEESKEISARKSRETTMLFNSPADIILMDNCGRSNKGQNIFFPTSVVLNSEKLRSYLHTIFNHSDNGKKQVILFLNLEKKALKWYGIATAFCYFQYESFSQLAAVQNQTKNIDEDGLANTMTSLICKENESLKRALYSLSEQDLNVPRIFLEAKKKAKMKNLPFYPQITEKTSSSNHEEECHNDYDDVVVLEVDDGMGELTCARKKRRTSPKRNVIEII